MSEAKKEVLEIEENIKLLIKERKSILSADRPLSKAEVDRLFDISAEIDWQFEQQSMLLPLIEEEKTQSRWDSPVFIEERWLKGGLAKGGTVPEIRGLKSLVNSSE